MKIKTITCHDVYNPGASLQAYALLQYLKRTGNDVEIIDYLPSYLTEEYKFFSVTNRRFKRNLFLRVTYICLKLPSKIHFLKRKMYYEKFKREYLDVTPISYTSNEELQKRCPKADVYIAGSDQIWNTAFPNGRDPAFYLNFVPNWCVKVSYAASFGSSRLEEDTKDFVKTMITEIDYVSVREKSGVNTLKSIGIEAKHVCDPVFLLEKKVWKGLALRGGMPKEDYIFVYDFDQSELIKEVACFLAQKYQLKIYTMFKTEITDRNFYVSGPLEFLKLIYHSRFVVTNSFHAIAFSIIFGKEFWVSKRKENLNSRMIDLLSELGLEKRMIGSLTDIQDAEIDYQHVEKVLREFIDTSKEYLDMSIRGTDETRKDN